MFISKRGGWLAYQNFTPPRRNAEENLGLILAAPALMWALNLGWGHKPRVCNTLLNETPNSKKAKQLFPIAFSPSKLFWKIPDFCVNKKEKYTEQGSTKHFSQENWDVLSSAHIRLSVRTDCPGPGDRESGYLNFNTGVCRENARISSISTWPWNTFLKDLGPVWAGLEVFW